MPPRRPQYCSDSLTDQGCPLGSTCPKRHDIRRCSCGVLCFQQSLLEHMRGKRHRTLLAGQQTQAPPPAPTSVPPRAVPEHPKVPDMRCQRCGKSFRTSQFPYHVQDHVRQDRLASAQAALLETEDDKEGIVVSRKEGIDFGIVETTISGLGVVITNVGRASVGLLKCSMRSESQSGAQGTQFSVTMIGKSKLVKTTKPLTLVVLFQPPHAGRYDDCLELVFVKPETGLRFVITRRVCGAVGSKDDHELLGAKAPYTKKRRAPFQFDGPIVPSLRPPTWTPTKWVTRLLDYKAPQGLIEAAFGRHANSPESALRAVKRFMPGAFNEATYGKSFQAMLHIEEEKMRQDLDAYTMFGVELKPNHPRYDLQVKGLAESRPSVLVGDSILVSSSRADDGSERTWHEGCVHHVYQNHVSLRFGETFSTYRGTKFDARFVLNRLPLQRMHQALVNGFSPTRLLFPGPEHTVNARRVTESQLSSITPIYRPLGSDEEQMETVTAIIHQEKGSVPFIVFGPPGTGKTVTIVEAMRQLLMRDPNVRILACAPSNSAADLIAQKLLDLGPAQLFRLNSISRRFEALPKTLHKFARVNENKVFAIPLLEELRGFRVVVATCISGGIPSGIGLKRGHFSHIFIDEAGQGKEPELMVPIKGMAGESTNIILAGDNQQLGPTVYSVLARSLGLKKSYLSRLMERAIYDLKGSDRGLTIVKLIKNFRSHPAILQFANAQFYDSELQACGDPVLTRSLENSSELPKKGFPVIFHGIIGRDEREESSPSFFNVDEVTVVKKYCMSFVDNRKNGIRPEHIGVITPYHAQRCKIQSLLYRDVKLRDIKVGSVEEFQGQERRIIIISTVRSSTNHVESDIRRSLGFVADPHRFNVAITRAQAMLIVVGNPVILSLDPLWRTFLNFVHTRGGWRGKQIAWDPEDPVNPGPGGYDGELRNRATNEVEEVVTRLKALIVQKIEDFDFEANMIDDSDSEDFDHPDNAPAMHREAE